MYGVQEQTLRYRTRGYIKPERRRSGPYTFLDAAEVKIFVCACVGNCYV